MMPLVTLLAAMAAGLILVPVSMRLAPWLGLVVTPREDRWGVRAVPKFGGLALTGAIIIGVAVALAATLIDPVDAGAVATMVAILFVLGVTDDRRSVSPRVRLLIEAAAGATFSFVVIQGQPVEVLAFWTLVSVVAVPLAVNATNLVDNADGLAGSLSLVTAATLAVAPAVLGLAATVAVPVAIVGAALAFLAFNRPPARTFMGDGGSLALGGALAGGAILLLDMGLFAGPQSTVAALLVVVLSFAAQLVDMALVVTSRLLRRRSPFQGGTDHTAHRLLRAGVSATGMLGAIVLIAAALGIVGLVAGSLATVDLVSGVAVATLGLGVALAAEAGLAHRLPAIPSGEPSEAPSDLEPDERATFSVQRAAHAEHPAHQPLPDARPR